MKKIPTNILKAARDPDLTVSVRIGKSGLTESIIAELADQLSARRIVKVKFNRGIFSKDDKSIAVKMICEQCNANVVEAKGNVVIIFRP